MVSYFPREAEHEDYACVRLPPQIGDEEGAPWLPDRKIRIFSNPAEHPSSVVGSGINISSRKPGGEDEDDEELGMMEQLNRDFVVMKEDVDKERLIDGRSKRRSFSSLNESERHIAIEIETKER